ncbi:MAG: nicotinate (nicotinamide) nucleotide adenylyltransferase [Gemmatimonadaceae bacterium]|nr:nicotinate (nicotinamide) nucleotide adenylyltransferase [Gemmatimonadaceae bacterium]
MRLGIFGGSFDPPHVGHLLVAQDAVSALSLDRLLIVPAAQQPLKQGRHTPAEHRLEMVRRCFEHLPEMVVDPIEIERGGLSFMVDTVETLQRRWPLAELYLLVGADVVATLPQWREPARLRAMARLVILRRNDVAEVTDDRSDRRDAPGFPVQHLATRRVDVSSTEIRARVREGRSIRGFVTDAVADYIASAGLYLRDPVAEDVSARA